MSEITAQASDVDLKKLKLGMSPRIGEQDVDHARALAHCIDACPPILIERSTSTVIDGVHRVLAARMLGRTRVAALFFDGTHDEAFLEAVKSNIAHGKPLTLSEREAAAVKILGMRNDWSDRLVASACGLSPKTVGRLRKSSEEIPQTSTRVGRDGRHRRLDSEQLRHEIASAIMSRPDLTAEELARAVSASPSTVRDVRKRLAQGEPPGRSRSRGISPHPAGSGLTISPYSCADNAVVWSADTSIRTLGDGEKLGAWLDMSEIVEADWTKHVADFPLSRVPQLIGVARSRAAQWNKFASQLEQRVSGRKRS